MNTEAATVKKRMLRSDIQQNAQCGVIWSLAIWMVWTLHTHQLGLESYVLIGNLLVAIGLPIFGIVVLRLCQLGSFAMMKRSKKYELIDDVGNTDSKQKLVVSSIEGESGRTIELGITKSNLVLLSVLYVLVVLTSFLYTSEIYFLVALALTAGLVATSIVILSKNGFSMSKVLERSNKSLSKDEIDELLQSSGSDTDYSWVSIPKLDTRIRFSRNWVLTRLYYLGMWLPLFLAIPLIGQLFAGAFWLGICVGVVYLFVVEMCTLVALFTAFERFFPPVEMPET